MFYLLFLLSVGNSMVDPWQALMLDIYIEFFFEHLQDMMISQLLHRFRCLIDDLMDELFFLLCFNFLEFFR